MFRRDPDSRHLLYHEVLEQLGEPGCALCRLGARAGRRYLESLCTECVTDPAARSRWQATCGVCGPHARELDGLAPRLTLAILYEDLIRRMEEELDGFRPRRKAVPTGPCPACAAAAQAEDSSLRTLAGSIDDLKMAEAYRASPGLCRPHTLALCERLPEGARRRVLAEESERLQRLREELGEVKRKHDYRFAGEPWGEEKTAPSRAVRKITGDTE